MCSPNTYACKVFSIQIFQNLHQTPPRVCTLVLFIPPANIGCIPSKISAGFAGFTAEQWMHWTTIYSVIVLRDYLPQEHYTHWCMYSKACSLMCRPYVHVRDIDKADNSLRAFVEEYKHSMEMEQSPQIYICMVT